jgi:UDP:flavonoid glycosyltransferase YjiC (YdhE family)
VSKGPQAREYDLAANMVGAEFLPQPAILPLVDLVITHGGNNTTTEALHFGKPLVVLPLFWDQYDNAQRVEETGLGVRLDTYRFTDEQLHAALDQLLGDAALTERLTAVAADAQARDGLTSAADRIEALAAQGETRP